MVTATRERWSVFVGIVLAWILSAVFLGVGFGFINRFTFFESLSAWEALAFALLISASSLITGIGWAARTRHFVSNIDGSTPTSGSGLDITLRYVTNTSEQLLIFSIGCICVFAVAPETARTLLPIMGVWFTLARAKFFFGYKYKPLARSVGLAATFHPTIFLFGLAAWLLIQ